MIDKPYVTRVEPANRNQILKQSMDKIKQYIESFPIKTQHILTEIRNTIKKAAPDAVESISYQMPCYKTVGKPLVYFAGFKKHIGFYATPSGHTEFSAELAKYKQGKGSVQFPIDQAIPYDLIARMVKFRVAENYQRYKK